MALIRQTIKQKELSVWKIILMICMPIFIMNIVIQLLSPYHPVIGTIGGLITLIGAVIGCLFIIYRHSAYLNYKLIEDELIMERVFGRANHIFLALKLSELEEFRPYKSMNLHEINDKKNKVYRFVSGSCTDHWYVGKFTRDNSEYIFIIEPNQQILNTILSFQKSY
ncbi:hypothetical protein [Inediibacterium massiliense]|uniref:hypothetical protein n=1 Tax=Inediibacterium massiliense TaxID=1658111 RepID=UPI0006B4F767|nr:hypothetical protein [Inediibacterium massiliense]